MYNRNFKDMGKEELYQEYKKNEKKIIELNKEIETLTKKLNELEAKK